MQEIRQQVIYAENHIKQQTQRIEDLQTQVKQLQQDNAILTKERNLTQQLATKRANELANAQSQTNELQKKLQKLTDERQ